MGLNIFKNNIIKPNKWPWGTSDMKSWGNTRSVYINSLKMPSLIPELEYIFIPEGGESQHNLGSATIPNNFYLTSTGFDVEHIIIPQGGSSQHNLGSTVCPFGVRIAYNMTIEHIPAP